MRSFFYARLAAANIRRNRRSYVPYTLTCIASVMMFYIICALTLNTGLGGIVAEVMLMGAIVVGIFSVIFLFYTNSFLVKRRKKELGLYNILGMEKRHLSRMMLLETGYIAIASMALGLLLGALLSKLVFLFVLSLLSFDARVPFELPAPALAVTVVLFSGIFLLTLFSNLWQVRRVSPIELLRGGQTGEAEPKTKWGLTLLGVLTLGAGYYIALTTKNPIAAIPMFMVAVVLVMIGTYCLFTAGSVALLKRLRRNKNYYYQTRHFTSVSGMIYRMKQNAVGLANICILSSAVLVMISSTVSLYLGAEDSLTARYPRDYIVTTASWDEAKQANIRDTLDASLAEQGLAAESAVSVTYLSFVALQKGDAFETRKADGVNYALGDLRELYFISLSDYNRLEGRDVTLAENEVLLYANRVPYAPSTLSLFDMRFTIAERPQTFVASAISISSAASSLFVVVRDTDILHALDARQQEAYGENASDVAYLYGFDVNLDREAKASLTSPLAAALRENGFKGSFDGRDAARTDFYMLYGGLLFLGIFLGLLFIMATVLIIYYKQISEGHDDKERFAIMQRVGMSLAEVKRTIQSQVLTVFFLPLLTAGVHIAFAFPVITKLLALLNLSNAGLFAICTLGCYVVFAAGYAVIYGLTARVYYRIVR